MQYTLVVNLILSSLVLNDIFNAHTIIQVVEAFPTGPGHCLVGDQAVGGTHLRGDKVTIDQGNIGILVNGAYIDANNVITLVPGAENSFRIEAYSGTSFRGILVRFQGVTGQNLGKSIIVRNTNVQLASNCEGPFVMGISHYDNSDKVSTDFGFITVGVGGTITMDVSIVFYNNGNQGSKWAHTTYQVSTTQSTYAPVPVPVLQPTITPISIQPTSIPIQKPIFVPVPTSTTISQGVVPVPVASVPVPFSLVLQGPIAPIDPFRFNKQPVQPPQPIIPIVKTFAPFINTRPIRDIDTKSSNTTNNDENDRKYQSMYSSSAEIVPTSIQYLYTVASIICSWILWNL